MASNTISRWFSRKWLGLLESRLRAEMGAIHYQRQQGAAGESTKLPPRNNREIERVTQWPRNSADVDQILFRVFLAKLPFEPPTIGVL
jgi:hypothetical protein